MSERHYHGEYGHTHNGGEDPHEHPAHPEPATDEPKDEEEEPEPEKEEAPAKGKKKEDEPAEEAEAEVDEVTPVTVPPQVIEAEREAAHPAPTNAFSARRQHG